MTHAAHAPEANSKILEASMQGVWRMDKMFHLGAMTGDESLPPALQDAIDEDLEEIAIAIGLSKRRAAELDAYELLERIRLRSQWGFLVHAATPVRRYIDDSDTCQLSWGAYYTRWVYGEDLASVVQEIQKWVRQCIADDRKKSAPQAA